MIKELALSSLLFSGLSFGSSDERDKPKNWWEITDTYVELMQQYNDVADDNNLNQLEKIDKMQEISERMRHVGLDECESFLGKDYNDCMRESNKQHDKDMDRCDRNRGGDKCYDRADKNNDNRRAACERVSHSDNARDTASSSKKTSGGPRDRR